MATIDLRHKVEIRADAQTVYKAIATERGQAAWWTPDCHVEERVGSVAQFWFYDRQFTFRMQVDALDPGKRVVWTCVGDDDEWKGTRITFDLTPEDGKTILRVTHEGWKAATDYQAGCNYTWGQILGRLKHYAETGAANPYFTASGVSV